MNVLTLTNKKYYKKARELLFIKCLIESVKIVFIEWFMDLQVNIISLYT